MKIKLLLRGSEIGEYDPHKICIQSPVNHSIAETDSRYARADNFPRSFRSSERSKYDSKGVSEYRNKYHRTHWTDKI